MEGEAMKIKITGFNPFGTIETEDHDVEETEGSPLVTRLMPLSMSVEVEGSAGHIRFDYETPKDSDNTRRNVDLGSVDDTSSDLL